MIGIRLFDTDFGVAALAWNGRGVCGLRLPASTAAETRTALLRGWPEAQQADPPIEIARVVEAAVRYFAGEQTDFRQVPVDLGPQEPLVARIYAAVRKLGWGETTTYGAIARELGQDPAVARAVGQAMARNPIPLIVPCHRVLAAGGRIGGFSAPGGSDTKARMLALEGATGDKGDPAQESFGF